MYVMLCFAGYECYVMYVVLCMLCHVCVCMLRMLCYVCCVINVTLCMLCSVFVPSDFARLKLADFCTIRLSRGCLLAFDHSHDNLAPHGDHMEGYVSTLPCMPYQLHALSTNQVS
jgi:hypothetical protein